MIERALRFGESAQLVGILTEPEPHVRHPDAPVTVFLNSGIIHRVGASRLYVQMARRLAEEGLTSLRFDFSGIGDSEARRDSLPFTESAVVETREAMDYLERVVGARSFHLMGLCSGADMGFAVAQVDPRVLGLGQLDPYGYRTFTWYLRHYGPRVLQLSTWTHSLRVRMASLLGRSGPEGENASSGVFVAPEYRRVFPPRREVEAGMAKLAKRGVRFFVCFTGDEPAINYPGQFRASLPGVSFGDRLEEILMSFADHTFTHPNHQVQVVDRFAAWSRSALLHQPAPVSSAPSTAR
jgi:hypothetical protein